MTDHPKIIEPVLKTEHFDIHQDWSVPIAGFYIIASIRPIHRISEFTDAEASEFILLLVKLRQGMKEVLSIDDVYLFENEDTPHTFHFWVFPRHEWMEQYGRKIESVRTIIDVAKKTLFTDEMLTEVSNSARKIKEYMSRTQ